jgi:hypothetical protein
MKTLLTIFTLVFTVMFSSTSFAGWTKVSQGGVSGNTYYVDFERIRKHDGYIYYWLLQDYLKPTLMGVWSAKYYKQGDCKLLRNKVLGLSLHKEPMGGGSGKQYTPPDEWDSVGEHILKSVCSR